MVVAAEDIKRIAVIGAGLMGHGIAQLLAFAGHAVALADISEEQLVKALENVHANLHLMASKGIGSTEQIEAITSRIRTTTALRDAVDGAELVIEAVIEDLATKQRLFAQLDELCPPATILATNTSVISITEIASLAQHRERIIGTHFWNPPYLIPLVEVIKGRDSSTEAVETAYRFLQRVGKHPVKVLKDVPGFIGNRLQHALWREAISIVENGIADAASVDEVIKKGFGIRLPVLGPLENADLIGLDLTLAIHDYILKHIESSPEPSPLLREKVSKGELGFKTGQGFRTWSALDIERCRKALSEHLLDWMRKES